MAKVRDCAAMVAFAVMVSAILAVEILNTASSLAPGMATGSGVVAPDAVDQLAAVFQRAVVPSQ